MLKTSVVKAAVNRFSVLAVGGRNHSFSRMFFEIGIVGRVTVVCEIEPRLRGGW